MLILKLRGIVKVSLEPHIKYSQGEICKQVLIFPQDNLQYKKILSSS